MCCANVRVILGESDFGLKPTQRMAQAIVYQGLGLWRKLIDYAISPRVLGRELKVHPLLAIYTVMVGGAVGGIVGISISRHLAGCLAQVRPSCPRRRNRAWLTSVSLGIRSAQGLPDMNRGDSWRA